MFQSNQQKANWQRRVAIVTLAVSSTLWGAVSALCYFDKLGDSFVNQGQFSLAVPFYLTMTTVAAVADPDHHRLADAWTNLGVCYEKMGKTQQAAQAQQIALQYRRSDDADTGTVATADGAHP